MSTHWFVLVPQQSEMNVSGTVKDAFVITTAEGSALDKQLTGNYEGRVTVNGRSGYLRAGPFTSAADVNAYLKVGAQDASTPVPGVKIKPEGGIKFTNPLSGLQAIGKFFAALGQASTWIRVAEGLLGIGLIAVGLAKITNTDTTLKKAAVSAAKVAAV